MTSGSVRVDGEAIQFPENWDFVVDVMFDGFRVWSFPAGRQRRAGDGVRAIAWPAPLHPYLHGETELTLREHVAHRDLAVLSVRFDEQPGRVAIVDAEGRPLSLDKWGNLIRTFLTKADDYGREQLGDLDLLNRVMTDEIGVPWFISYGSLLGAVRAGSFIAHDSDADTSYVSRFEVPPLIAAESFRIERELHRRGWGIDRISAGFLIVWAPGRTVANHIDIFTSYFVGDYFAIDRWVRGPAERSEVLPLGEVSLEGHVYPAPASPEKVLELTYGPHWRIPDPSFKFTHPRSTMDRARGWLGNHRWMNGGRPGPDDSLVPAVADVEPSPFALWVAEQLDGHDAVLEVGCRSGVDAVHLARTTASVHGIDHMADQISAAVERSRLAGVNAQFEKASLYDLRQLVALGAEHAQHARNGAGRAIVVRNVLEHLRPEGKGHVWLLARTALREGGRMFLEITEPGAVDDLLHAATERGAKVSARRVGHGDVTWCELGW